MAHYILLYYPFVRQVLALCAILAAAIHRALQVYVHIQLWNFQFSNKTIVYIALCFSMFPGIIPYCSKVFSLL